MWANRIDGPSKNWVTWEGGVPKILPEKDDNPEKRGEVATFLLLYSSIAFTLSVCVCVCVGGGGEEGEE